MRFDHLGVFTFSHEEGTAAYALGDRVPRRIKLARQRALICVQRRLVERANRRRVGQEAAVFIDGPASESPLVLKGRLESQAPEIDLVVCLTGADPAEFRPGDLVEATVTGARGCDLIARPVRRGAGRQAFARRVGMW